MKKGQIYTGKVQYTDFPNKAVVITESDNPEDNGKRVIVKKMDRLFLMMRLI